MIRVDIRRKAFGDDVILKDILLDVAPGEAVAILGSSGIGKSTLLRVIAGVDAAFEGAIQRPDNLAMVFQEPVLLPWRSALQNLTIVHPSLSSEAARDALERVGLAGKANLFPGQLSLGQQRRLALARAFAGRPQLLLMDEPYVSLDPQTVEEMLELTEALIAETRPATILVTHSEREAERLADRQFRLIGHPAMIAENWGSAVDRQGAGS